ncbi:MAG: toll/interleukin-1 receptor domain-containing protein [Phycisphaerae bacterium]
MVRFEATKPDALFPVLDAIAWLDLPTIATISQFAGIDPRTAGKLLKNCILLAIVEGINDSKYNLRVPYPAKGNTHEKEAVVREALVRLPLLASYHQFRTLGDSSDVALRKAATVNGIAPYAPGNLQPLLDWAKRFQILEATPRIEDLVNEATREKEQRHQASVNERIVFISHSSKDKPFIRRLTSDLTKSDVKVWLDEQNIMVGDSISERISQALAKSDFFVITISKHSTGSDWVQRELNASIMAELSKRSIHILPIRLDDSPMPTLLTDKMYADFSTSYDEGLKKLVYAIKAKSEGIQ